MGFFFFFLAYLIYIYIFFRFMGYYDNFKGFVSNLVIFKF